MVYHYCSLEIFLKIIMSKELFLFNATSMNDSLETNWIIHLVNEELSKRKNDFKDEDIKNLSTSFFLNRLYPYISCFSLDGDSLSQWKAYADDGKGVAIGFNEECFGVRKWIPGNTAVLNDSIGYFDCIYDEVYQRKLVNNALDISIPIIKNKESKDIDFIMTGDKLNRLSVIFKNPVFAEEKEVRLIHVPIIRGDIKDNSTIIPTKISDISHVVKKNSIVSYFRFDMKDKFDSKLIPEIVLGPKNFLNTIEFEILLSIQNLTKTTFRRSKASYR